MAARRPHYGLAPSGYNMRFTHTEVTILQSYSDLGIHGPLMRVKVRLIFSTSTSNFHNWVCINLLYLIILLIWIECPVECARKKNGVNGGRFNDQKKAKFHPSNVADRLGWLATDASAATR